MSNEAAIHAYVLLPNALHTLLHAQEFDYEKHLGVTQQQVAETKTQLDAVKPDAIVDYLHQLPKAERDILHRALLTCLRHIPDMAFEERLGLPKEAGGEVLELLRTASERPASPDAGTASNTE